MMVFLVTPLVAVNLGFLAGRGAQRVTTIFCPKFSKSFMKYCGPCVAGRLINGMKYENVKPVSCLSL